MGLVDLRKLPTHTPYQTQHLLLLKWRLHLLPKLYLISETEGDKALVEFVELGVYLVQGEEDVEGFGAFGVLDEPDAELEEVLFY